MNTKKGIKPVIIVALALTLAAAVLVTPIGQQASAANVPPHTCEKINENAPGRVADRLCGTSPA